MVTKSGNIKQDINADSIIIGTHMLNIQQPTVSINSGNPTEPIFTITPRSSANDNEAGTSQAKPRDPKCTRPKWCPPGLTKKQKRKLQRLRNQEKIEKEDE